MESIHELFIEPAKSIAALGIFALGCLGLRYTFTRSRIEIRESTQKKLTFNIYPVILRVIAETHILFVAISLLIVVLIIPKIATLTCDHVFQLPSLEKEVSTSGIVQCEILGIGWLDHLKKIPISHLHGAILETRSHQDKKTPIRLYSSQIKIRFLYGGGTVVRSVRNMRCWRTRLMLLSKTPLRLGLLLNKTIKSWQCFCFPRSIPVIHKFSIFRYCDYY